MPCGSHFIHHDDCTACTGGRDAEDRERAEKFIAESPVPLTKRSQEEVRSIFTRRK